MLTGGVDLLHAAHKTFLVIFDSGARKAISGFKRDSKYCTMDIKDFYLGTPMKEFEYIQVPLSTFPAEILRQYDFLSLVENGHIMVEVCKGVYGIPQAGILINTHLRTLLSKHGYT